MKSEKYRLVFPFITNGCNSYFSLLIFNFSFTFTFRELPSNAHKQPCILLSQQQEPR